jgi:membrane associated rhomboid family serine protease
MAYATSFEELEQRNTPAVYWLIGLCVAVFFVQATVVGEQNMAHALGYAPGDLASRSLWTLVTYMFVHGDLLHIALNMWTLWIFGPRVERAWGSSTFTWFYLWCGLGGWAFHYMFERDGAALIGASAACLGVAVAFASRYPDEEIFLFGVVPMKTRWFVATFAAINVLYAVLGASDGTAYYAHVGGMVAAWVYLRTPSVGSLDRFRRRIAPAPDYGDDTPRPVPKNSARPPRDIDDIVAQSKAAVARARPVAPAPTPVATPAQPASTALDAVLDKIAADKGMHNLTTAERLLLDEWSKRLRDISGG